MYLQRRRMAVFLCLNYRIFLILKVLSLLFFKLWRLIYRLLYYFVLQACRGLVLMYFIFFISWVFIYSFWRSWAFLLFRIPRWVGENPFTCDFIKFLVYSIVYMLKVTIAFIFAIICSLDLSLEVDYAMLLHRCENTMFVSRDLTMVYWLTSFSIG